MDKLFFYIEGDDLFLHLDHIRKATWNGGTDEITITMDNNDTHTFQNDAADYVKSVLIQQSYHIIAA